MRYMSQIEQSFKIKEGSIGSPKVYLGANCQKNPSQVEGVECWGMSAEQYCKEAVKNVKKKMRDNGYEFNKKLSDPSDIPFPTSIIGLSLMFQRCVMTNSIAIMLI